MLCIVLYRVIAKIQFAQYTLFGKILILEIYNYLRINKVKFSTNSKLSANFNPSIRDYLNILSTSYIHSIHNRRTANAIGFQYRMHLDVNSFADWPKLINSRRKQLKSGKDPIKLERERSFYCQ